MFKLAAGFIYRHLCFNKFYQFTLKDILDLQVRLSDSCHNILGFVLPCTELPSKQE